MSIKTKIIMLTGLSGFLLTALFLANVMIQKNVALDDVEVELDDLGRNNLATISKTVRSQVEAFNALLLSDVANGLKIAWDAMSRVGKPRLDSTETVEWEAIDQFTKEAKKIRLPKMMIGEQWVGQNRTFDSTSIVVDDVKKLVGGTATIFQKMNDRGDMLRVCTNVEKLDRTRAIGTYIPAINPDGTDNPVIKTVMAGQQYNGRAYVVNAWYLTSYEPIYNDQREIIGTLYFGVKQEKDLALRKSIMNTTVGKTGYVFVLDREGHYIISKDGLRDGENIWNAKDSDGNLFIQSMIRKSLVLGPGEVDYENYPWQNVGETSPRTKIACMTYFEPWDWVIGASVYDDDFKASRGKVNSAIQSIFVWGAIVALVLLAGTIFVAIMLSDKITRPIGILTEAADEISLGNVDRKINIETKDETGKLAEAFKRMQTSLVVLMKRMEKTKTGQRQSKVTSV